MDQATNMETQLAEQTLQEPALAQSGSNVLRRHIKENPKKTIPNPADRGTFCPDDL